MIRKREVTGEELEPLRLVARISSSYFAGVLLFVVNVVDDVLEGSALDSRVETCLSRSELNNGIIMAAITTFLVELKT